MIDKKAVGERIRGIRLSMGYNTTEFADIFNPKSSNSLVSRWEKGINLPNAKRLSDIAFQGQISVDELLHGKRPDPLIEWIEEKVRAIKLTGFFHDEAEAHYNKGYADAMLEMLNQVKGEELLR